VAVRILVHKRHILLQEAVLAEWSTMYRGTFIMNYRNSEKLLEWIRDLLRLRCRGYGWSAYKEEVCQTIMLGMEKILNNVATL